MYKLIEFFRYIFFICHWKTVDLWNRIRKNKTADSSNFLINEHANVVLLNLERYNSLFAAPTSNPEIYMPKPIFDKIIHSLPPSYVIPDLKSLKLIIDAYNNPAPYYEKQEADDYQTDYQIVEKIKSALPADYILPLPIGTRNSQPVFLPEAPSINIVKTFAPKVSANLTKSGVLQTPLNTINSNAVDKVPPIPKLTVIPEESDKSATDTAGPQEKTAQDKEYRFLFFK